MCWPKVGEFWGRLPRSPCCAKLTGRGCAQPILVGGCVVLRQQGSVLLVRGAQRSVSIRCCHGVCKWFGVPSRSRHACVMWSGYARR